RDLAFHNGGRMREEVLVEDAAKSDPYWDVGKQTVDDFRPILMNADAVFVKGAPGVFEDPKFDFGTAEL
ncbi:MAG: phosphoglycerate kinase, partial [Candidatus Nanohaloarchaea archaeon]